MSTSLYRHFANDGSLLYVGISLSWPQRTKAHAKGSRWFEQVARVEIENFPTREAALDAEREAIKREKPAFNVIHNRASPAPAREPIQRHSNDPLLRTIHGRDVIVGPALVYRDEKISVMIAHGDFGTEGTLTEVILGEYVEEVDPSWYDHCASIMVIRRGDQLTINEAHETRDDIIQKLRRHKRKVEFYSTDIALAVAYAAQFPSEKSRKILDDVASERVAP